MSTVEQNLTDLPLDAALREAIVAVTRECETPRAAGIDALKLVQKRFGFVSDRHLAELAELLGMTPAELDGVATFYNLIFRRPVGRHVILLCDSVACWMMGGTAARLQLRERLGIEPGQTTADGLFTLLPIVCLGCCDHAPAMMIDDDLHGDLDAARLDAILGHHGWRR
ncbi:MAG TPA: NADH-quinone oxidoreductase subunit NuoE [Acidiphilium sp.]|nr:NADH-quinone oxidoreductase subunit NuoE [Steroidobacteraceae bacterium]OYV68742.1 MAG: NADH-quinone oxidoreductase subunit E [Acidiphilium sp. 21-60-14]OYV89611.1 MAG: NADH-quinone oxidoreductase subunit E [Acidiphilium sp. 37-60-79]OZB39350.1 MAG: NADH-quinone oxidoreductase subunit E [Acidiphilium sp. 34-60-192]HQT88765.1 NADH-quinone oxidoreductase subunit NuoE [Acidiphilium sp.]